MFIFSQGAIFFLIHKEFLLKPFAPIAFLSLCILAKGVLASPQI